MLFAMRTRQLRGQTQLQRAGPARLPGEPEAPSSE